MKRIEKKALIYAGKQTESGDALGVQIRKFAYMAGCRETSELHVLSILDAAKLVEEDDPRIAAALRGIASGITKLTEMEEEDHE